MARWTVKIWASLASEVSAYLPVGTRRMPGRVLDFPKRSDTLEKVRFQALTRQQANAICTRHSMENEEDEFRWAGRQGLAAN